MRAFSISSNAWRILVSGETEMNSTCHHLRNLSWHFPFSPSKLFGILTLCAAHKIDVRRLELLVDASCAANAAKKY